MSQRAIKLETGEDVSRVQSEIFLGGTPFDKQEEKILLLDKPEIIVVGKEWQVLSMQEISELREQIWFV
ncbi:hypothetical protein PHLCEN_2v8886 [Hermanssonia centrifuga]|uniref:Uncharacterized protein n=1 Tax=Hermanssonia centrifuga TaxID=98765 RepID=A0A2R6NSC6_9APHY|nr:hypothetical protein PHLCEN_2v8886 [Hermanssonia centrifuga]